MAGRRPAMSDDADAGEVVIFDGQQVVKGPESFATVPDDDDSGGSG
jgi:hypothetical protein